MKRRDFIQKGALGAAAFAISPKSSWSTSFSTRTADSRIEVLFDEPLGTISPNIYGHFAENLGGVFYDGIWVGEKSPIPNVDGLRRDVIDHMRKIKAPVIRYPGGCFAGSTTMADARAASGYPEPFRVKYWGVGNESWGCGGEFTPQEYAVEFRRYSTWLPKYNDSLSLIASGPNTDDWNWTREFLAEVLRKGPRELHRIYGMALHHYAWNLSRGKT